MKPPRESGSWVGLALSALLFAYALAARVAQYFVADCFEASENVARAINLTPLVVLIVVAVAFVLDLRALRAGESAARHGRFGLALLLVGVVVLAWTFVDSLGDLLACGEGD
jgi:hypothetical protein